MISGDGVCVCEGGGGTDMFMCYIKGEELGLSQDHAAAVSCEPSTTREQGGQEAAYLSLIYQKVTIFIYS